MQKDVQKFGISDKRGRAKTSTDPYIPEQGRKEPALCGDCRAVYRNKRWELDPKAFDELKDQADTQMVTCPACQKIAEKYPEGVVTLRGDYLWNHEEEIRNILKNEETKTRAKNPLARIIRMEREGDEMVIETTEEKLAEHLGRALHKSHQGELKVSWTEEHSICRVSWERMH